MFDKPDLEKRYNIGWKWCHVNWIMAKRGLYIFIFIVYWYI